MQVQKTTIESLFTHERRYLVPLFQRPYVWSREKQWEPLWDDLQDLAERELEAAKAGDQSDDPARPHFMGAIVLQPHAPTGDHLPVFDVIDGQQRMTTFQLLLLALRDVAAANEDAPVKKWSTLAELFPEYKRWIETAKPFKQLEDELREFARYADHFRRLLRPEADTPFGVFAERLAAIDINSVYPLVIGLLGEDQLPDAERTGIFADLESFLVRRMICSRPTKSYTRKFLDLLKHFREAGVFTREAFRALLVAEAADVFDWPTDKEFETAWNTVDAYRTLKPERVEMVLRAVELASRSAKSEPIVVRGRLTVEHVMPQSWERHWPLPAGVDEGPAREAREEVLHDFGNLTALTQSLNSEVSNGPAAAKLTALVEKSNLQLTKWFTGRTTWTEDDIRARGKALFEKAVKIWGRP